MNAERWDQVQTLFKEIVKLDYDSRTTRLEEILDKDPDLYREIHSLLVADADRTSILDGFALDSIDISGLLSLEGTRIGPFEVDRQIASGGMGSVYLARRVQGGFEQWVALKLIKLGMDSEHLLHRFESERSILARLEHSNIARLVDGGLTKEGRPWFAMEYVEGETLLDYSHRIKLPIEDRLELFLDISDAVQYAHRNLIVHRDLKPGNILVTGEDSHVKVKLLDFGIARLLEDAEPESDGAMTRAYASPEQRRGDSTTTSTDIYSLGILLYELITGCHPEPEFRSPNCVPQAMNRELAAICRKAMMADPARRFETVSEMEEEIRAWLDKRPVASYSNKPGYRFRKLFARNLAAAFVASFALIAIVILVLAYTLELKEETERAQNEAIRASRIAQVLGSSLQSIDPMQNGGQELTARGMVDMSTTYINNQLVNDPRTRSELLIMMAEIYANLIAYDVADSVSGMAEELRRETQDTTSFAYIDLLANRSIILDKAGKFEEGLHMMHRALDLANGHLEPNSLEFASVHLDYTYHLDAVAEYEKVDSVLMLVQPIYEQNREEAGETYADFIFYLGTNYRRTGNFEKAEKYLFQSLELSRARYPDIHEQIASTLNHISSLYQNMGEYEKALPYAIESHQMRLEIFGPAHLNTLAAHANTARTYSGAGRLPEAAETYREVLAIFREEYGNDNFYIAGILQSYGNVYLRMKDYTRAETIMRESLEHSERLLPAEHIRQAYPLKGLADALRAQNRFEEALGYAERAFQIRNSVLEQKHPDLMTVRHTLGHCLWNLDRRDEAELHLREALAFYNTDTERYQSQIDEIQTLGF